MSIEEIQIVLTALGPFSLLLSIFLWRILRNRVKSYLITSIDEYFGTLIDRIEKNPTIIQRLMPSLMKSAGIEKNPGSGTVNLFGFKIPAEIVQQFLPMIVKGGANAAQGKNPFE